MLPHSARMSVESTDQDQRTGQARDLHIHPVLACEIRTEVWDRRVPLEFKHHLSSSIRLAKPAALS